MKIVVIVRGLALSSSSKGQKVDIVRKLNSCRPHLARVPTTSFARHARPAPRCSSIVRRLIYSRTKGQPAATCCHHVAAIACRQARQLHVVGDGIVLPLLLSCPSPLLLTRGALSSGPVSNPNLGVVALIMGMICQGDFSMLRDSWNNVAEVSDI